MNINLEWYRVYYWTALEGSLSKAANRLHITQPAVSHTIKQLEAALGGQLFFRTPRGVSLTVEGERLLIHVEQALRAIETGENRLSDMLGLRGGEINIGASDTLCKHYLLPVLEKFRRQYPKVAIRVTNRTTPETVALLKQGRIDFGVVSLPGPEDKQLKYRPCAPLQDCLIGGKEYAHLASHPFPLEELEFYPLLLLERGSSTRSFLDRYAASFSVSLKPELELGSLDLLSQFARSGFGLAFHVKDYIQEELDSGSLIHLPLVPPVLPRSIGIASLKGVPLSSASKAFLDMLPEFGGSASQ